MSDAQATTYSAASRTRYLIVGVIVVLAFFAAYGFASAQSRAQQSAQYGLPGGQGVGYAQGQGEECGGDCCGAGSSAVVEGAAVLDGDVQRISVDLSENYFNPNVIVLAAGLPSEITFGQGGGCMAELLMKDFGVYRDLTQGGTVVELPALDPGEYSFSCGMEMVFGTIVVQ